MLDTTGPNPFNHSPPTGTPGTVCGGLSLAESGLGQVQADDTLVFKQTNPPDRLLVWLVRAHTRQEFSQGGAAVE
jgi:hypothetical protein